VLAAPAVILEAHIALLQHLYPHASFRRGKGHVTSPGARYLASVSWVLFVTEEMYRVLFVTEEVYIGIVAFVSWVLFVTEEIGHIIEEPFGNGRVEVCVCVCVCVCTCCVCMCVCV
jgi:glycerol-3-phosphate acyltransferase PlsY